ncbi:MAG: flagellar protein FliT [Burkholderiales bacterium]
MTPEELLELYRHALDLTQRMLVAARSSDWDGLVKLEVERDRLIENARHHDVEAPRSPALRQQKRELLQQIITQDEEIRTLTQDWMRELRDILSSVNNAQRLSKTYTQN